MNLEHLPLVLLWKYDPKLKSCFDYSPEELKKREQLIAKFVVVEGRDLQSRILALGDVPILDPIACPLHSEVYQTCIQHLAYWQGIPLDQFSKPTGAGLFEINGMFIVEGRSTEYGKYNQEIVRPLLKPFIAAYFPGKPLVFDPLTHVRKKRAG